MADQIHVVYSAATGRIRSIVVPTVPGEPVACNLGTGEALLHFDMSAAKQPLDALQAALNQQTGLVPANDRYAMVDAQGNVLAACLCDPACGDLDAAKFDPQSKTPGMQVVKTDTAGPGWTYDKNAKTFAPPPAAVSADPPKPTVATADAPADVGAA